MTTVRRAGATSAATLCGLALAVVLAQVIAPEWTRASGLDLWNLPEAMAQDQASNQETALIDASEERLQREIELADHICEELIRGDMTLAAAIDEMEPLLVKRPGFSMTWPHYYRAPSIRHGVGRYFIGRIARFMEPDDQRLPELLARLEREYAELK